MVPIAVDVAYWDLSRQRGRLTALAALLSADENARVARFALPTLRERYVLAHGILRETLAALTGEAPDSLRFERGPHGKPALAGDRHVTFNLSKSGDGLLIATARDAAIGCDLEPIRRNREARAIAERWFSAAETSRLAQMADDRFDRAFATLWVRKEALLKAVGTGLQGTLQSDAGDPEPNETPRPVTLGGRRLWLADLAPLPGWIAAVAADKPMAPTLAVHA